MGHEVWTRRAVAVAFVAVVVAFLMASAAYVQVTASISRDSLNITENASPSIAALAAARVSLIRLHDLLSDQVDNCSLGRPVSLDATDSAAEELRRDAAVYVRLPAYPEETRLAHGISADLKTLYGNVEQSRLLLSQHRCEEARALVEGSLTHAIESASIQFMDDIQLNARHAAESADTITRTQRRAEHLTWLLNVAAVIVAVLAAGAVLFGLDRRDRIRSEQARLQEERARELELFSARVAHDIRSPLAAVVLALDLAQKTNDPARWLGKARNGLRRVEQVVDALYQFAWAGGSPQPGSTQDAAEVVTDVFATFQGQAAEANLMLEAGELLHDKVGCPPGVLMTTLANLVANAIKYSDGTPGRVRVEMSPADELIRFTVADTGPGLPKGTEEKVFDPHVRLAPDAGSGLGLGLATVRRFCRAYGGNCGVLPGGQRGATFWVEFPREPLLPAPVVNHAVSRPA